MFRSKPIGWITAGTLFCVAGVALACRLRDCKETTAGANAAACPVAVVEPDDKADSPKPAETAKAEEKKEKDAPKKLPSLLDVEKKPAVGESVTPAAIQMRVFAGNEIIPADTPAQRGAPGDRLRPLLESVPSEAGFESLQRMAG